MFDSIKFCQRRIQECTTKLALAEVKNNKATSEKLKTEIDKYTQLIEFYSNNKK